MQTPEEFAARVLWDYDTGALDPDDLASLVRTRDREVRAEALAGLEWEEFDVHHALADDGTCSHVMRRLVGPWEPEP